MPLPSCPAATYTPSTWVGEMMGLPSGEAGRTPA